MALSTLTGSQGYKASRVSSLNNRAIGKFTDSNHLSSLMTDSPQDYDKKIISLFTEMSLYSNDLLQMLNKSTPFYLEGATDDWKWKIGSPYRFPVVTGVPDTTASQSQIGIDGHEFEIVMDSDEFFKNQVITFHRIYSPDISIIADPVPHPAGFLYLCTLNSTSPSSDFLDPKWLKIGQEAMLVGSSIGEFDTDLPGLGKMGDEIEMFETMSSGFGYSHKITNWADSKMLKNMGNDKDGNPLDIIVYNNIYTNNATGAKQVLDYRWEPLIEHEMRKAMLREKASRMIWSKGGSMKTGGSKQEIKKLPEGLYFKLRNNGNLRTYNRGQFSLNIIRDVVGDLFYRRVAMADRKVKLYTNEAGIEAFQKATIDDLRNAGFTIMADNRFIQGTGRKMVVSYAFNGAYTTETGDIEIVHLMELDQPQTNSEYGQNKKSTPVFIVFDISNSEGGLSSNIREVRRKSRPSMTWGYVDGRVHHLGFGAMQGMSSSSTNPWYELWMEDRADIFVEDPTRTILIEELPSY